MTLELTAHQRQLLMEGQFGRPVSVVDPLTKRTYVLITQEQFAKVRLSLEAESRVSNQPEQVTYEISPGVLQSQQAFWRDLPELLKQRKLRERWVCYHRDERVGFAKTKSELVQICLQRGLDREEFYVDRVQEESIPPWEATEIEESLFECED